MKTGKINIAANKLTFHNDNVQQFASLKAINVFILTQCSKSLTWYAFNGLIDDESFELF